MNNKSNRRLPISIEQSKLLGSTLRVKIIGVLAEKPRTSKQVATHIGESPGNVHYHIQKLLQGKLIELVEEKRVGGVVEKYYQSVASSFDSPEAVYPELDPTFNPASSTQMSIALQLKKEDQEKMLEEFRSLMKKWVFKTTAADYITEEEFVLGVNLISRREKEEEPNNKK